MELRIRTAIAKRSQAARAKKSIALSPPRLTDHWPDLRPASLPVPHRKPATTPLLSRSLLSLGRQKDPSYKVHHDPLMRAPFPFPHSPPGSSSPRGPGHPVLDSAGDLANLPEVDSEGPTSSEDDDTDTASPPAARASTPDQPSATTTTGVDLKFLTINVQKAGANSPSLIDIITIFGPTLSGLSPSHRNPAPLT